MHKYERHLSMSNQVKTRSLGSLSHVRYLWHDSVILTQIANGCFTLCCLLPLCSGFLPFPVGRFSLEQIFFFLLLATLPVNCISLSLAPSLSLLTWRGSNDVLKGFFFFQLVEEKWTRSECVRRKNRILTTMESSSFAPCPRVKGASWMYGALHHYLSFSSLPISNGSKLHGHRNFMNIYQYRWVLFLASVLTFALCHHVSSGWYFHQCANNQFSNFPLVSDSRPFLLLCPLHGIHLLRYNTKRTGVVIIMKSCPSTAATCLICKPNERQPPFICLV